MQARRHLPPALASIAALLQRGFDAVASWVTKLSWWKFFLFAALALMAGSILQDELFPGSDEVVVVRSDKKAGKSTRTAGNVLIDDTGIRFRPRAGTVPPTPPTPPKPPASDKARPRTAPVAEPADAAQAAAPEDAVEATVPEDAVEAAVPKDAAEAAAPEDAAEAASAADTAQMAALSPRNTGEVHIDLPPEIGEELSNAIEAAVEDAAEQKVTRYHKEASTWFKSFVTLLVLALFATKALMGGKTRAEAETVNANAAAERESMQRQLSEARMHTMQAQVEPHFLFNTLASVEFLIETDPPRASAMQRSLIQYLRAVLPQMRENSLTTTLGREADMVSAYLNLLKMRMEERLTVVFDIPETQRNAAFPPMMLQSMVENAIKHGLECKAEGGTLSVRATVSGNRLRVTVADDGVGFGVMPSTGTGLGLSNIRERLKLLHGDAARLSIDTNTPTGVIVTIEVPFQQAR